MKISGKNFEALDIISIHFTNFSQDISALHQRFQFCSLANRRAQWFTFTAQVDVAQGRIHGDKPSVLPNLPSSMQALQTLISNLVCNWRGFVGCLCCLRFCLPDGLAAFRFWKRCVQAPLLYADEQSEQSWASAKIIALPQERSQKGKGGRWMEAVCVGCFQGQSADQYPQVCSRCVAPSAALKASFNSVEAIKVKISKYCKTKSRCLRKFSSKYRCFISTCRSKRP